jgi:hypothetical protein
MKRLINRAQRFSGFASLGMVAFYVGRLSVDHKWIEAFCIVMYLFCSLVWLIPIHREAKREEQSFHRAMRELQRQYENSEL